MLKLTTDRQTDRQINRQDKKQYAPDHSIRGHKIVCLWMQECERLPEHLCILFFKFNGLIFLKLCINLQISSLSYFLLKPLYPDGLRLLQYPILSANNQCQAIIYLCLLCRGYSWQVRLANQDTLTTLGHPTSHSHGSLNFYCVTLLCHSDNASFFFNI